jgi:hypothetical protein
LGTTTIQTRGWNKKDFFFISCTAEKETKPSSGTLWYQYKDLEK